MATKIVSEKSDRSSLVCTSDFNIKIMNRIHQFLLLIIVSSIAFGPLQAQVYTGNLTLDTQAAIDTFPYSSVTGNLTIGGIDSINGLSGLTSVGGNLVFDNSDIPDMDGLSSLTSLGGDLTILAAFNLTNVDGLSGITAIGGDLTIFFSSSLLSLDGLSNLTTIGGELDFFKNGSITHLDALSNLVSVGGDFGIGDFVALTNLNGLSNLVSVGGDLSFDTNKLIEYCGIYPLLSTPGGLGGTFWAGRNATNPDSADIVAAGPCTPACSGSPSITGDDLSGDPILLQASGSLVSIGGSFTSACGSTHTVSIDWGNGTSTPATVDETNTTYSNSFTYTQTGVYLIEITITDDLGESSTYLASQPVMIYDPTCGSARLAGTYFDPADGLKTVVSTFADYASGGLFTPTSRFIFFRRTSNSQIFDQFESSSMTALVISGNSATISGQGRFTSTGAGPATHTFSISFDDITNTKGVSLDPIQTFTIQEIGTGSIAYQLSTPTNVQSHRVKVFNTNGCRLGQSMEEVQNPGMKVYPNPFQSTVQIPYELAEESEVSLSMYDLQGRMIRMDNAGRQAAGSHIFKWNATNQQGQEVAAGIYLLKLQINQQTFVKQIAFRPW